TPRVAVVALLWGAGYRRPRAFEEVRRAEDLQPHLLVRVGGLEGNRVTAFRVAAGSDHAPVREKQRRRVVEARDGGRRHQPESIGSRIVELRLQARQRSALLLQGTAADEDR